MINYLDDLFTVRDILSKEKTVILLADNCWSLACDAYSPAAVNTIHQYASRKSYEPFVMVDSIPAVKQLVRHIHPRIETLLIYHERPINVIYNARKDLPDHLSDSRNEVVVRYTRHNMLSDLIKLLGSALLVCPISIDGINPVKSFDQIPDTLLHSVDYVFQYGRQFKLNPLLPLLVSFDAEGELVFHRE